MKFKTNINCQNCIRSVTPHLNGKLEIDDWRVDTDNPDKILYVEGDLSEAEVIGLVEQAGFKAEKIND